MDELIVSNRLQEIMDREHIGKDTLSEILNVSIRQVNNYLNETTNFPVNKAIILQKKYRYSLDYIYCCDNDEPIIYAKTYNDNSNGLELEIINKKPIDNINFFVNLKDIMEYDDSYIYVHINKSFIDYLASINILKKDIFSDSYSRSIALKQYHDKFVKEQKNKKMTAYTFSFKISELAKTFYYGKKSRIIGILDDTLDELEDPSETQQENIEKEIVELFESMDDE